MKIQTMWILMNSENGFVIIISSAFSFEETLFLMIIQEIWSLKVTFLDILITSPQYFY